MENTQTQPAAQAQPSGAPTQLSTAQAQQNTTQKVQLETQGQNSSLELEKLNSQITSWKQAAQKANVKSAATLYAVGLGISPKTIPYVIKMADLAPAIDKEGKVNEEAIKTALNKVLEDIPELKTQTQSASRFTPTKVGTAGNNNTISPKDDSKQQGTVAKKRWNRFN